MSLKRLYLLFMAQFKVNLRIKAAFFFSIIFPLIFIAIFGIAFQFGEPGNSTISVALINNDQGIPDNAVVLDQNGTQMQKFDIVNSFVEILNEVTFEDNETNIFAIEEFSMTQLDEARIKVEKQELKALIIIPEDFSIAFMAKIRQEYQGQVPDIFWANYPEANYTTEVEVQGDPSLISFTITTTVVDTIVKSFFNLGIEDAGARVKVISNIDSEGLSGFDITVPGLVIYAIINNLSTVASVALADVKSGVVGRLSLSKMRPHEYTLSLILSQILLALIQIVVMFLATFLFGFPFTPNVMFGFIIAIFLSLGITGIGILLAGLVKDPETVGGLAAIIGTPMAFLAGAFFEMPNPIIIPAGSFLGNNAFRIFDLLPPRSAIVALRLITIGGREIGDILYEFSLLVFLSMFYLTLGVIVYSKKHFKPQ